MSNNEDDDSIDINNKKNYNLLSDEQNKFLNEHSITYELLDNLLLKFNSLSIKV